MTTTKLSTELSCYSAILEAPPEFDNSAPMNLTNGMGCKADNESVFITTESTHPYALEYIGYYRNVWSQNGLKSPNCSPNSTHQILIPWTALRSDVLLEIPSQEAADRNLTALFCETRYWKQRVSATIIASTLEPADNPLTPMGPVESLTADEFNSTAFEYLLHHNEHPDFRKANSFIMSVTRGQQLRETEEILHSRVALMPGFATALHDLELDQYVSEEDLKTAFEKAHKFFFSMAVGQIHSGENAPSAALGTASFERYGVYVSRKFAILVECLLVFLALLVVVLAYLCHRSQSKLLSDPGSIDALLRIVRNSAGTRLAFKDTDFSDEKSLGQCLVGLRFSLNRILDGDKQKLEMKVTGSEKLDTLLDHIEISEGRASG